MPRNHRPEADTDEQIVADWKAFVAKHGHRPRWRDDGGRRLLVRIRQIDTDEARALFADGRNAPARRISDEQIVADWKAFVAKHGHRPRWKSGSRSERRLLVRIRQIDTDEARALFDQDRRPSTLELAEQVAAFVAEHDRTPREYVGTAHERKLGRWLMHSARPGLKKGSYPPDVVAALSADPRIAHIRRVPDQNARLQQLRDFVALHKRLPKQYNPDEKVLAQWMANSHRVEQFTLPEKIERAKEVRQIMDTYRWSRGKNGRA